MIERYWRTRKTYHLWTCPNGERSPIWRPWPWANDLKLRKELGLDVFNPIEWGRRVIAEREPRRPYHAMPCRICFPEAWK